MKKIAIALALALSLGGCAELQTFESAVSLVQKSGANPVTKDDLYKVESAVSIGFTALKVYKTACAQGAADKNCRSNVAAIQAYTRQIPPLLSQLRGFVKNNDQINASVVYNQLTLLYTNAKNIAAAAGVNLGG